MNRNVQLFDATKPLIGRLDGDDIYELCYLIDMFDEFKYRLLVNDLYIMAKFMWCEHGLDYGTSRNWDSVAIEIMEIFGEGYSPDDLATLMQLIQKSI